MAHLVDALLLRLADEVGHAAAGGVSGRTSKLLVAHLLASHSADHIRASDVHLADLLHHEDEVGDGRRVDSAAGGRADDNGDLWNDSRVERIAEEYIAVSRQAEGALLDAGAAGVVEADHGAAGLGGQVHDLADLLADCLGEGAAHHREVLGEGEDLSSFHLPVAGDHGIPERPAVAEAEIGGAVSDEGVQLLEGTLVHQPFQALTGGELAPAVLLIDPVLPASQLGGASHRLQGFQLVVNLPLLSGHLSSPSAWNGCRGGMGSEPTIPGISQCAFYRAFLRARYVR